jgi:hypothetical protein
MSKKDKRTNQALSIMLWRQGSNNASVIKGKPKYTTLSEKIPILGKTKYTTLSEKIPILGKTKYTPLSEKTQCQKRTKGQTPIYKTLHRKSSVVSMPESYKLNV